jgi:glycosyltransferase involved in cell wall biosynthesis
MNQAFSVGFDAKRAFCNSSGLGNYARNHIRMMVSALSANRVVLFSPYIVDLEFADEMKQAGVRILLPTSKTLLWRQFGMAKTIKESGVSVFHALSPELPVGLSIPAIVTVHDTIAFDVPAYHSFWNGMIYRFKTKHALQNASMVVSVSHFTARRVEKMSVMQGKNAVVLHPVFMPQTIKSQLPDKKYQPYFLYIGNLEARKNLGALLEAFRLICKRIPHTLVLAGKDAGMRQSLEEFVKNMDLKDRVLFTGKITEAEKAGWLNACDALIYPSVLEGFGLPVLEGLHADKPVITSQGTSMEEAGGDCAVYIDPNRPEALAAALMNILENTRQRHSHDCSIQLQKFSAERLSPSWVGLYSLVANRN